MKSGHCLSYQFAVVMALQMHWRLSMQKLLALLSVLCSLGILPWLSVQLSKYYYHYLLLLL